MATRTINGLLHPREQKLAIDAVEKAERMTSAEFKVHVESSCADAQARAAVLLEKLKVSRTAARNGVLLYAVIRDRRVVVTVDHGVRADAERPEWKRAVERTGVEFKNGRFGHGLAATVLALAELLRKTHPRRADDANEVEDQITSPSRIPSDD